MIYKLSIIIPVYNEEKTIERILEKLKFVQLINGIDKEIIIVNDHSSDASENVIKKYLAENSTENIKYVSHFKNKGKGASIHTGILHATGDYLILQDADLEYNPEEFNLLLKPVIDADADVVYGSRFIGGNAHRILFFWHTLGNKMLTFLSNMFSNLNLSDMETCYKLIRTDIIKNTKLQEKRFGFEPEITAKLSKIKGIKIYEVGISYYGRTYKEGKKINWIDGIRAFYCIFRYNLFD